MTSGSLHARSSLAAGIKTYITVNHYTRNKDFSGAAAVFDNHGDLDALYRAAGLPLAKMTHLGNFTRLTEDSRTNRSGRG
jgi:hypothetical protein